MVSSSHRALAVAATAMLLAAFVGTATNIAVPVMEEDFPDASLATISWVVSGFNVAQVTFMLLGGRLADRVGRRRIFLRGLAVFTIGAAVSGLVPTIELVIAARVVQGIGVSMMLPASLAAVLPEFPAKEHGSVVSWWSAMGVLGATIAPTLAAGILEVSSWRVVFIAAAPISALAYVAGRRVLREGPVPEHPPPLDIVGAVSGTVAVAGLTIAIVQGRLWGWTDARTVVLVATAIVAAAVFVRSSARHPEPLLDLELRRIRKFTVATAAAGLLAVSTSATWFLYPLFMSDVWGYSLFQIGLAMTPGPAILVVLAPIAGRLADRHGFRWLLITGATLATLGTAWMAWRLQPDERYVTAFLPGTLGIGAGMALMLGPANAAALSDVPPEQLGSANATYNTVRMAAAAVGVAISAAIIGDAPVGERLEEFRLSWWTMVVVMAFSPVLLFWRYPRRVGA
ncbi:MAG: DHA2 family efflux MFS transporter permease subunit [Acidimicrobiales bacterium]